MSFPSILDNSRHCCQLLGEKLWTEKEKKILINLMMPQNCLKIRFSLLIMSTGHLNDDRRFRHFGFRFLNQSFMVNCVLLIKMWPIACFFIN